MPLFTFKSEENTKVVYWKIEEDESFFLENSYYLEKYEISQYTNTKNRLQWLAGKRLMFDFFGESVFKNIKKDILGKPYSADKDFYLSLSHTDELVGMVVSDKNVGIDIQRFNSKLHKIAHKYISERDLRLIFDSGLLIEEKILLQWSVKEALFKAYGKGQLDYRKNLIFDWDFNFNPEGGKFMAMVSKNDTTIHYDVEYGYIFEDYLMALVTKIID
jgi:4'-phosphopantetheinyl transferase